MAQGGGIGSKAEGRLHAHDHRGTRDRMNLGRSLAAMALASLAVAPGSAAAEDNGFTAWLHGLRGEALEQGISAATLDRALSGVAPIPRVLELDRRQPELTLTFARYVELVVPTARVEKGRRILAENRSFLDALEATYGVPPEMLVALWGAESEFGTHTGTFPVVGALATLAYDGRRSAYFRKELLGALRIVDAGHIEPDAMRGSWAGAMGQTQFMPSTFLSYAIDQDGDGRRDIWTNPKDALASAANYLARVGWRRGQGWSEPVLLPTGFDPSLASIEIVKPLAQWRALGLSARDGTPIGESDLPASVVIPDGAQGPAYLVYENFRVLMRWNRSIHFAAAVGILAESVATN